MARVDFALELFLFFSFLEYSRKYIFAQLNDSRKRLLDLVSQLACFPDLFWIYFQKYILSAKIYRKFAENSLTERALANPIFEFGGSEL